MIDWRIQGFEAPSDAFPFYESELAKSTWPTPTSNPRPLPS